MHRHGPVVVLSDVVEDVSDDDSGPMHLPLGHHARQNPPSEGDIIGAFLANIGALKASWGTMKPRPMFL